MILGAGVAGLAAARSLAEAGQKVLLVEARERVGGRLLTVHAEGEETPIELGAEFVHGRPPELLALLEEAGLAYYDTSGRQMRYDGGVLEEAGEPGFFPLLEELSVDEPDQTFDEFLAARKPAAAAEDARRARQYVEGFNAADATRIGTRGLARQQAAEDAIEGERSARLAGGYQGLAEYLRGRVEAAGCTVVLGAPVSAVEWRPGQVAITTVAGLTYQAGCAVIALPLGVIQARSIRFVPEAGVALGAAEMLASGTVVRLVLRFRTRFWVERASEMRFLFASDELPPTWWTTQPHESGLLTGWLGGPRALAVDDTEQLLRSGLRSLEQIFGLRPRSLDAELVSWHTHDWQSDPYSLGAYSYAPAGAGDAAGALTQPVEDTLFFAGEYTDTTGHLGTVHGALRSGVRAAAQVLQKVSTVAE